MIKTGRALLGAFVIAAGLFAGGASASAQALTETVYATGTGFATSLSFAPDGQLYILESTYNSIKRVPAGGGHAVEIIPNAGNGVTVGPDNALYVSKQNGDVIRYAPGSTTPDSTPYATNFGSSLFAIAFDTTGRLYGVAELGVISRTASGGGRATEVCNVGVASLGLVITAAGNPVVANVNGVEIKECVGSVVSNFATLPGMHIGINTNYSLAKDADGNIYTAYFAGDHGGEIYRIGPSGGAATLFATSTSGVTSIAFRGNDMIIGRLDEDRTVGVFVNALAPAPTAVPTLSEWAMILLGVMLAGGAAVVVQRRRIAV